MKQTEFVKGIGKRVDEIIANARYLQELHISIDVNLDDAPVIHYSVTEAAVGEEIERSLSERREGAR